MRKMERADYEEDLFLNVRVLIEQHGVTPASVRRIVTQAVNNKPKGELRERLATREQ